MKIRYKGVIEVALPYFGRFVEVIRNAKMPYLIITHDPELFHQGEWENPPEEQEAWDAIFPCPCGGFGVPTQSCVCSTEEIRSWRREKFQGWKAVTEITSIPYSSIRILVEVDKEAHPLLRKAYSLILGETPSLLAEVVRLAQAIAKMDGRGNIKAVDIAEAIQYIRRVDLYKGGER